MRYPARDCQADWRSAQTLAARFRSSSMPAPWRTPVTPPATADSVLLPGDVRPAALLLPALSAIATRDEMQPLADRLGARLRGATADWPGFGAPLPAGRGPDPVLLDRFLDDRIESEGAGLVGIAAGHGATLMVQAALRNPGRFGRLILVAPTWRGPLPTMTRGERPALCRRVRTVLEAPVVGPALFRLNVSRRVIGWMMREHVYADPANVTPALTAAKQALTRRPAARFATAAFVSGGLDPVTSRAAFLALFDGDLPPVLLLRPRNAPARSAAEMDALAATGRVTTLAISGALAPHEETPDEVAAAILAWLGPA